MAPADPRANLVLREADLTLGEFESLLDAVPAPPTLAKDYPARTGSVNTLPGADRRVRGDVGRLGRRLPRYSRENGVELVELPRVKLADDGGACQHITEAIDNLIKDPDLAIAPGRPEPVLVGGDTAPWYRRGGARTTPQAGEWQPA